MSNKLSTGDYDETVRTYVITVFKQTSSKFVLPKLYKDDRVIFVWLWYHQQKLVCFSANLIFERVFRLARAKSMFRLPKIITILSSTNPTERFVHTVSSFLPSRFVLLYSNFVGVTRFFSWGYMTLRLFFTFFGHCRIIPSCNQMLISN